LIRSAVKSALAGAVGILFGSNIIKSLYVMLYMSVTVTFAKR